MPMVEMVACPPMSARLSLAGCQRMWRSAQERRPEAWEAKRHCLTCQLGAERAGVGAEVARRAAIAEAMRRVCPRCERRAARLIGGRHCVSCYNRQAEVRRGRNCKGGRPRLTDVLHAERVAILDATGRLRVLEEGAVIGAAELVLHEAKRVGPGALFGRPPAVVLQDAA